MNPKTDYQVSLIRQETAQEIKAEWWTQFWERMGAK